MIRVGILDFDSGHSVVCARHLNHSDQLPEKDWVDGARVVAGCSQAPSFWGPEALRNNIKACEALGVEIVATPQDMLGKVDAVMVLSDDGRYHLERARPFLEAGVPTYVDKPLSFSPVEAAEIIHLAKAHGTPLLAVDALRYLPAIRDIVDNPDSCGQVVGAMAFCGAIDQYGNSGLLYYGMHAFEILVALMGPELKWVSSTICESAHLVTLEWADGRLGTVRAQTAPKYWYGFTAWCEKDVRSWLMSKNPDEFNRMYAAFLKAVVGFFATGVAPVSPEETAFVLDLCRAALLSESRNGERVGVFRRQPS